MTLRTVLLSIAISASTNFVLFGAPTATLSGLPKIGKLSGIFAKCQNTTDWTYYVDADAATNLDYCRKNDGSTKEPAICQSGKTNASNSGHDLCKAGGR